jgi:aminopeptidase N
MNTLHQHAEKALLFYIQLLGFYPFKYIVLLSGDVDCGGGYPQNEGVIVIHKQPILSSKRIESWKWIVAHEIGHMYWGYYVLDHDHRENSKLGWLTKGIGLYIDYLYTKQFFPSFDNHERMIARYRRSKSKGLPTSFFATAKERASNDDYNTAIDHGRAFMIIREVANEIGEEKFIQLCIELLHNYAGKKISYPILKNRVLKKLGVELQVIVD